MVWDHIYITKPHLVYVVLGGFTTLFMLCSSIIKERIYLGEASVASLTGVIFGPHAANLIDPRSWGNNDTVTMEFSRLVLVVQCFAIGIELPRFYMERHWRSILYLLLPVAVFGWLVMGLIIWGFIPEFSWLDGLLVAAPLTITDPILASSVMGNGKFAQRVPKHLRDLLSAESGCNDVMATMFMYLSYYSIKYNNDAGYVAEKFFLYVVLYECLFGAIYGFFVGFVARQGIKYAEKNGFIDRDSFLVLYFVVALFCTGSGSILGLEDLLVGFAAGIAFSNDGWFREKTEESHVTNVIDLLLNLTYFVYLGTIIPWEQYNSGFEGLYVWRLVVIAILIILFRRIPVILALKPLIPDIKTWREALFIGHFGPIGVGALFISLLARGQLEHGRRVPLSELPDEDSKYYHLIYLIWPIVTFVVMASIIVHGSSVALFALGKRINTLPLTITYSSNSPEPLPKISAPMPIDEYDSDSGIMYGTQGVKFKRNPFDDSAEDRTSPQLPPPSIITDLPGPAAMADRKPSARRRTLHDVKLMVNEIYASEVEKRREHDRTQKRGEAAKAFQFSNTIIIEDAEGEVLKTYELPRKKSEGAASLNNRLSMGLNKIGLGVLTSPTESVPPIPEEFRAEHSQQQQQQQQQQQHMQPSPTAARMRKPSRVSWILGSSSAAAAARARETQEAEAEDDRHIRFEIDGVGKKMDKDAFIREVQKLDAGTRRQVVDESSASRELKVMAKQERPFHVRHTIRRPHIHGHGHGHAQQSHMTPPVPTPAPAVPQAPTLTSTPTPRRTHLAQQTHASSSSSAHNNNAPPRRPSPQLQTGMLRPSGPGSRHAALTEPSPMESPVSMASSFSFDDSDTRPLDPRPPLSGIYRPSR